MNEFFAVHRLRTERLVGFAIGILVIQQLPQLPPWPAVAALLLAALLCARRRLVFAAAIAVGASWALAFALLRAAEVLDHALEKTDLVIEGSVATIPQHREDAVRFEFDVDTVLEPVGARVPRHLRLSWYRCDVSPKAGQRWRLAVRLRRPRGMMNPGGMDYELWLFSRNIGATGYVRDGRGNRLMDSSAAGFDSESWRQVVYDRLAAALNGREFAGVLAALAMGHEEGISADQWDLLRRTGTAHLVAISGSHIALIAGWCFVLVRWVAACTPPGRWSPPAVAAVLAFVAAAFYSALAGFAIPTQRALVVIAIVTGGMLARRHLQPLHTLGLAGAAVLLWDPLASLAPGFWLSYSAVALIWFVLAHRLRHAGGVTALWRINWATSLGLAPILLLFFGQIPLVSPLANLLAVPVIGLIVIPLSLCGTLLLWFSDAAAAAIFDGAEWLLGWTWAVLERLGAWPAALWSQAQPPFWTIPCASLGAALLLAPRGVPSRWLGLMMLLPALTRAPDPIAPGAFELTVLDVGQGSAAVVRTRHYTLVFDTGARLSERFEMGSAVIAPFLRHSGVRRVDTLVVSHGDMDHSGGTASLLRSMPSGLLYSSIPEALPSPRAVPCRAGQDWFRDGVHFMFLSPEGWSGSDNDQSCVLSVSNRGHRVLLTGDIERLSEAALVRRYGAALVSDVLVVPHHGSNTSSTRDFLQHVKPRLALISAGYLNRFGFPHPHVMARLEAVSAAVLNTAHEGAVTIRLDPEQPLGRARSYRREHARYWNAAP